MTNFYSQGYEGGSVSEAFRKMASKSALVGDDADPAGTEGSPKPSPSQGCSKSTSAKRELAVSFERVQEADSEAFIRVGDREEIPAYYVSGAKNRAKSAPNKATSEDDSRTELMKDFTSSFSTFVQHKTRSDEGKNKSDNIASWAQILGDRVRELDIKIRGRFMHHLDGLVLDAEEGNWIP